MAARGPTPTGSSDRRRSIARSRSTAASTPPAYAAKSRRSKPLPSARCPAVVRRSASSTGKWTSWLNSTAKHNASATAAGDAIEATFCETALQLLSRPASHHELVVAGTFLTFVDQDMPLGQEKAAVLPIELSDACEHEPAAISVDTPLPVPQPASSSSAPGNPPRRGLHVLCS